MAEAYDRQAHVKWSKDLKTSSVYLILGSSLMSRERNSKNVGELATPVLCLSCFKNESHIKLCDGICKPDVFFLSDV